jgi:hypothetical protein
MYLLMMVLDDSNQLAAVLNAWRDVGVPGITIVESTGINRILPRHTAQPMFAGFSQIFAGGSVGHHTIFAIIDSLSLAEDAARASEEILGDLTKPHTGIIFVVPVEKAWGLPEPYDENMLSERRNDKVD